MRVQKGDRKFQSHAGSIEAKAPLAESPPQNMFQSHAGSIEARMSARVGMGHLLSFNPTLVRLRRVAVAAVARLVRAFQSHAGSIEAASRSRMAFRNTRSFNPTLVRLRHGKKC